MMKVFVGRRLSSPERKLFSERMLQGALKIKANTVTDQSRKIKERKRLDISSIHSAPKPSAERVKRKRLRKKLSAATDVGLTKEEILCSTCSSSAPLASDMHLNTLESSKHLGENDDSRSTIVPTSPDIHEPICTVFVKEEPLQEFIIPSSANEDAAHYSQEESIGSPSEPLSFLEEEIKVKQEEEEEEIVDCHVPQDDFEPAGILQGEYSPVSTPSESSDANLKKSRNRNKCAFTGCSRTKEKFPHLHFFQFPFNNRPEICEQWVRSCDNEALRSVEKKKLKWKVVCDMHFTQDSFTSLMRTKLTKEAVPTIFVGEDDEDKFHNDGLSSFPNTNTCSPPEPCPSTVEFVKPESSIKQADSRSTIVQTSLDIREPICTVIVKEEPLQICKMDHKYYTQSEIDKLLRGDLSDVEGFEDGEEDVEVTEEVLVSRIQDFEQMLEELDDDALPEAEESEDGEDPDDNFEILRQEEFPNENIPPFQRLTKKQQKEWVKQKEIKRWRNFNNDDNFPEFQTQSVMAPPPQEVLYPREYFHKFFDNTMIEHITDQTNLYSTQKNGECINTSVAEMEQFIGMNLLAGIVKMPAHRMYWAAGTRYPPVADVMSRNRFNAIRNNLHINDNTNIPNGINPNHDRLFKIRPFVDALRNNMRKIDVEDRSAVGVINVPFKGRSQLKQYNPQKPHKWSIKIFALASVSGLVHDFEIYVGKGTLPNTNLGISGDIVLRLVEVVPKHLNYKVFVDNCSNSHKLMCALKNEGILALGTVRDNRSGRCPFSKDKDLLNKGRGFSQLKIDTDNKVVACKWVDNKVVSLLSTYSGIDPVDEVERWSAAAKTKIQVPRPAIVREYNASMGGVDLHDMLVELYRNSIRVSKPYLRIYYHMVDMCVVNAWLLYRRHLKQISPECKPKTLVVFKAEIAESLIKSGKGKSTEKKRGRPSTESPGNPRPKKHIVAARPAEEVRYDGLEHWPIAAESKMRCKLCIGHYSTFKCNKCNVHLCMHHRRNCFVDFHRK